MTDIVEWLLNTGRGDHKHRYSSRSYTCSCDYDDMTEKTAEAASEILRLRAEVERLAAKAAEWDQRDGNDGAACSAIREMLDSLGVPRAAFIDDHVANAYLHGKAEERERAAQIAERHPGVNFTNNRGMHDWRIATGHDIAAAIRQVASGEGET